jgi:DEAD/DEAH box helicase domain-containing protein
MSYPGGTITALLVERSGLSYNPPLADAVQEIRRSVITESRRWTLALLQGGIKTILFAHSRVKTDVGLGGNKEDTRGFLKSVTTED